MAAKKLTGQLKQKLIQQALEKKLKNASSTSADIRAKAASADDIPNEYCDFKAHPSYRQVQIMQAGAAKMGVSSPFFRVHDGLAGATTFIDGRPYINYASYNYLGLSGDPRVNEAAKNAVNRYGTSVSASRPVSGERPIHRQLENAIAELYQAEDAIAFVSGHATNVSTIGHLFGPKDLILHDDYIHNSSMMGATLSGAKRLPFEHNSMESLEAILRDQRHKFERVLIVTEGLFSMDGDFPDLVKLIGIKKRYKAFLMVDEAHSLGVLGNTGRGLFEQYGVNPNDVDIWMGTLSKTLSACGGYIAGEKALIEHLKFLAPGFLYSVGMPAQVAAPALKSLEIMQEEPERIKKLQTVSRFFMEQAQKRDLDTGSCEGIAIIPVITGNSIKAAKLSERLFEQGINVQPILYPAVPENSARLRFFLSADHTEEQIIQTLDKLEHCLAQLN